MGFNPNTSWKMVFTPSKYGGVGVVQGFSKQGTEGIFHLMTQIRWGDEIGIMMVELLSQIQLLYGEGVGLLENPAPLSPRRPRKNTHIYYSIGITWVEVDFFTPRILCIF